MPYYKRKQKGIKYRLNIKNLLAIIKERKADGKDTRSHSLHY